MGALLVVAVLGQLVAPCGTAANCVRVGEPDGGQVQLSGAVSTVRYATPDGGGAQARLQPMSPLAQVAILGGQSRTSTLPDVVIGGANSRDGGYDLVRFTSGGATVGSITSNGAATFGSITGSSTGALGKFTLVDAGALNVVGQETIGGLLASTVASGSVSVSLLQGSYISLDRAGANSFIASSGTGKIDLSTSTVQPEIDGQAALGASGKRWSALYVNGPVVMSSTVTSGSCTWDAGTPAQCDATVTASTKCICAPVGATKTIAAGGCAVSLSSTTLTITGPDSAAGVVNYHCF